MNKNDLVKRIKDDSEKIDVGYLKPETLNIIRATKINPTETYHRPNFTLKFALGFVCLLVIALIVFLPIFNNSPSKDNVSLSRRAYGIQAATMFSFANSYSENLSLSYSEEEYDEIASKLNEYMLLIEEVINKDEITYSLVEITDGKYQYRLELSMVINSNKEIYVLFFNETALESDFDDLDEVSSKIEGIVTHNNLEYRLSGQKEVEGNETEVELKMYLNDNNDYLVVSQEIESHENEYQYEYHQNGRLVKSFELSIESKFLYKEIELEIKENGSEISLEVEYYNNKIIIEYEMPGYSGEVTAKYKNDKYQYDFGDHRIEKDKKISAMI